MTDEEVDAWPSGIREMIDSGRCAEPGWNAEVLGQFAMADDLPARLCADDIGVIRATGQEEFVPAIILFTSMTRRLIPAATAAGSPRLKCR